MNKPASPSTTYRICDFHYHSQVTPFYASNKNYADAIVSDFKSVIRRCIRTAPNDPQSIELEHFGATRYNMWDATNKELARDLLQNTSRLSLPRDTNSINIELSSQEVQLAWSLLTSIPNLVNTVRRHLGGDFVVQEAYHFVASNYNKSSLVNTSGFWHRDSVGRRIKVFICLNTVGSPPITSVLPCTYLDPIPRQWEMIRVAIPSKSSSDIMTEDMKNLNIQLDRLQPLNHSYRSGDVVLLDTNAIHRGVYASQADQEDTYRHLLQISLIPKSTLDLQCMLHKVCWAQKDVYYPASLFHSIPLHTPPFYPAS